MVRISYGQLIAGVLLLLSGVGGLDDWFLQFLDLVVGIMLVISSVDYLGPPSKPLKV